MAYNNDLKEIKGDEDSPTVTQIVSAKDAPVVKDVWGDLEEGGPNYRGLGW